MACRLSIHEIPIPDSFKKVYPTIRRDRNVVGIPIGINVQKSIRNNTYIWRKKWRNMVMNKVVYMNHLMRELSTLSSSKISEKKSNIVGVQIYNFISSLKLNYGENQKWLTYKTSNFTYNDILSEYTNLTDYEWDTFELYLDSRIIEKNIWGVINYVILTFEQKIEKFFTGESVCLIVIVQKEEITNINIRLHLNREREFILDPNLDNYNEPILYVLYNE